MLNRRRQQLVAVTYSREVNKSFIKNEELLITVECQTEYDIDQNLVKLKEENAK